MRCSPSLTTSLLRSGAAKRARTDRGVPVEALVVREQSELARSPLISHLSPRPAALRRAIPRVAVVFATSTPTSTGHERTKRPDQSDFENLATSDDASGADADAAANVSGLDTSLDTSVLPRANPASSPRISSSRASLYRGTKYSMLGLPFKRAVIAVVLFLNREEQLRVPKGSF